MIRCLITSPWYPAQVGRTAAPRQMHLVVCHPAALLLQDLFQTLTCKSLWDTGGAHGGAAADAPGGVRSGGGPPATERLPASPAAPLAAAQRRHPLTPAAPVTSGQAAGTDVVYAAAVTSNQQDVIALTAGWQDAACGLLAGCHAASILPASAGGRSSDSHLIAEA